MLLFKLIILFLCFVLIILLMKVTTNRNYRHSIHHSHNLQTRHDRNNHYHDSHCKNNHGHYNSHHNHLHSHEHNFHGLRYYYQRCDALSFGSLKRRLKIKNRIVPYLFSINV